MKDRRAEILSTQCATREVLRLIGLQEWSKVIHYYIITNDGTGHCSSLLKQCEVAQVKGGKPP